MQDLGKKDSVSAVVDAIHQWRTSLDPFNDHMRYWFRGQANATWRLQAKLYRIFQTPNDETILMSERHMVQDFRLMSASIRGDESPAELYFLQQHYGMPTRLLDWTTNPLIALYFACESHLENKIEQDGKVFMLDAQGVTKTFQQDKEVFGIATDHRPEFKQWMDFIVGWNKNLTGLFEESFPVRPTHFDRRISLQQGVFTFHPPNEKIFDRPEISAFMVPADKKGEMRLELRNLNINRFTVFGDLPNLSLYLQEAYEPWTKLDLAPPPK
jgi:FRG domain